MMLAFHAAAAQEPGSQVESSIGIDVTSQYFFRGILQEKEGVIVQPWADFVFPIWEGKDMALSFNIGIWNSLHDGSTGSGGVGMTNHYELDAYAGIGVDLAGNLSGSITYVVLSSPNSAFATVQELDVSISFDDSGLFGGGSSRFLGFQPSVLVVFELDGQSDGGGNEGIYIEVGVEPSLVLIDDESQPVSASFAVAAGFSLSNYFEGPMGSDESFGFVQGGVSLSTPLSFVPARMGSWSVSGGVGILFLGDNLESINGGDNSEVNVSFGLGIGF